MISNHWNIEKGLEKKARIKNAKGFVTYNGLANIKTNNKYLLPKWCESEIQIMANGFSKQHNNPDCILETKDGVYSFLSIHKDSIVINNFDKIVDFLIYEHYYKQKQPLHSKLPFDYTKMPVKIRNLLFHALTSIQKDPGWPSWPIEKSVELIRYLYIKSIALKLKKNIPYVSFWPHNKKFAISITHDCDTASSFKNIEKIRDIERKYEIKSSWNILSNKYAIDKKLLKKLMKEGCEIGLHGYNHDNKTPFLKRKFMVKRFSSASEIIKEFQIKGFRSESLLRNHKFLNFLTNYFEYDSSTCDTDIMSPVAKRNGTCTIFPFFIRNMVEIPITLPQDYRLMRLKKTRQQMLEIWKNKIDFIRHANGAAILLTHPDSHIFGDDRYLDIYENVIKHLASFEDGWTATANELSVWWKERSKTIIKNGKILNSKRAAISYVN